MAKIALVSEKISSTAWQLALALKAQQHEIILITSHDEKPEHTDGIEVLTYFKKWNIWEAVRLFPVIFGIQGQILHLIIETDKALLGMIALATFAKAHPTCVLTTSVMQLKRRLHRRNPMRYLLAESDIVTFPSAESMAQLRGLDVRRRDQGRAILPPVLNLAEDLRDHSEIENPPGTPASEVPRPYIVLPFFESEFSPQNDFSKRLLLLARRYHVVLMGSMDSWPARQRKLFCDWTLQNNILENWSLSGTPSSAQKEQLLKKAEALWLAGCELSPSELIEHYLMAIHNNCTLVLDHKQAQIHAGLWRNEENSWILSRYNLDEEIAALLKKENLKTKTRLTDSISEQRHWIDIPLNELNRLYNKALLKL